jgi:site-specific recombinase
VRFLLQLAGRESETGGRLRAVLAGLLTDLDIEQMLATGGIPRRAGFIKEGYERLLAKILPRPDYQHDANTVATGVLGRRRTIAWIDLLPATDATRVAELFGDATSTARRRPQLGAAMLTLASEAQAVGLSYEMRRRFSNTSALDSPFGRLVAAVEVFLASTDETYLAELRSCVADCQALLATIHERLEETGVSVDLFYRSERTRAQLARLLVVAGWLHHAEPLDALRGVVNGVRRERELRGIRALLAENMRLLSRRIAERNAETGEHYIALTRAQYRNMLAASAGGGALMTFAVYLKFGITAAHMPPFWEGLAASLNYATIFVLIALAHFTVATKQPAMTAPALAARMRDLDAPERIEDLVAEAAALVRSQVASVFGNLLAVTPGVLLIAFVWWLMAGAAPLGEEKARSILDAHSILGPSFLFAAYTGMLLWLSGLFSGWADNAFTLRQLHQAIATNRRLVHRLGEEGALKRANWWKANIAGLAGNIGLGLLLGLTPVAWAFFGVPMEVRHVTLSTGQVAVAAFTVGPSVLTTAPFLLALGGLVLIGVLNVGISFLLALLVAMRAVDISPGNRWAVYRAIRRRLFEHPGEFIWPPRDVEPAAPAAGSHPTACR